MKVSLNWLNDYVKITKPADKLAHELTMVGLEVKGIDKDAKLGDTVFDVEVTTNRPDWLSHVGIAREAAALYSKKLLLPETENPRSAKGGAKFSINIEDSDLCPYYSACLLEGVKFGKTPDFMVKRLSACGLRPVNFIVDVTNYVLLELGQPLHAFDTDKLAGRQIIVRRARLGEKIVAIDGASYPLAKDDLVIADTKGPIAIGGVMGGQSSEVGNATKNVLLESAFFKPASVRATSRRLGLFSESSYRFERRVDPLGVDRARERTIYLIRKYGSIRKISPVFSDGKPPVKKRRVILPFDDIEKTLGISIAPKRAASILKSLDIFIERQTNKQLVAQAPSFRCDLSRPIDLIEELARIYGYERVPETLPHMEPIYAGEYADWHAECTVRECLRGSGFDEVLTFSLVEESVFERCGFSLNEATRIINPQHKELKLMRPSILPSLMEVVRRNLHQGIEDIRIFEVGSVYGRETKSKLPREEDHFSCALTGTLDKSWKSKGRTAGLFDLKGVVEIMLERLGIRQAVFEEAAHPFLERGATLAVKKDSLALGHIGLCSAKMAAHYDIEPHVFLAEFRMPALTQSASFEKVFTALERYPSSRRDVALLVGDDVKAAFVIDTIRSFEGDLIRNVELFDVYTGKQIPEGKKSLAISIEFQARDRTLSTEEVESVYRRLVKHLTKTFNASIR